MNKNDLTYFIGIVILFIMGILGDDFIKAIILLITSVFSVMESNYITIRKQGII